MNKEFVFYEVWIKYNDDKEHRRVATFADWEELSDCRQEVYGKYDHRIVKVTETREVVE